jgi:hypothetical protein
VSHVTACDHRIRAQCRLNALSVKHPVTQPGLNCMNVEQSSSAIVYLYHTIASVTISTSFSNLIIFTRRDETILEASNSHPLLIVERDLSYLRLHQLAAYMQELC